MRKQWIGVACVALMAFAAAGCDDETGPEDGGVIIDITVSNLPVGTSFDLLINDSVEYTVDGSGSLELTIEGIPAGTYDVALGPLPAGCTAAPDQQTVDIDEGEIASVAFTVTCVAT